MIVGVHGIGETAASTGRESAHMPAARRSNAQSRTQGRLAKQADRIWGGAAAEENLGNVGMPPVHGDVKWCVALFALRPNTSAVRKQKRHYARRAVQGGEVQRREALVPAGGGICSCT